MPLLSRLFAFVAVVAIAAPVAAQAPTAIPSDLSDYVNKPDPSFAWELKGKTESPAGTVYDLYLVSQTWHDIKWDHGLQVIVPTGAKPQKTMLIYNTGGTPNAGNAAFGMAVASRVKAPIAFLYGIPKQPLYGGKKEDALIAETFVRYMETEDSSWPLLFPMAKSLVKAMDAIQAFAKKEWNADVTHFVVTGASKRGWTSWLTAASGDKRVKAIAPMVIDTLNMRVQMENQVKAFGQPSEMIRDYVDRKLIPLPETSVAQKLWYMIDPWVYREKLTLPKMLIHGTNDPYWPQDAMNTYWDDLKGEKHVLYVPNAGHGLREEANGKPEILPTRAINTLAAFARSQIFDKPLPKLEWKHSDRDGEPALTIQSDSKGTARVWQADAETRDFRKSKWTSLPLNGGVGPAVTQAFVATAPKAGFRAVFGEVEFNQNGQPFTLSTQIRILEAKQ